MPRFAYLAIDPKGAERRGAIEAAGEAQARERLASRQWHVVRLGPDATASARRAAVTTSGIGLFATRLKSKQLALFTRQLASLMMVSPLEESLRTISRQTEKPKARAEAL